MHLFSVSWFHFILFNNLRQFGINLGLIECRNGRDFARPLILMHVSCSRSSFLALQLCGNFYDISDNFSCGECSEPRLSERYMFWWLWSFGSRNLSTRLNRFLSLRDPFTGTSNMAHTSRPCCVSFSLSRGRKLVSVANIDAQNIHRFMPGHAPQLCVAAFCLGHFCRTRPAQIWHLEVVG